MFEFYYNNKIYKAKNWVESSPNNFLIMAEDQEKNINFIYSKNVQSLPATAAYLRSTSSDVSRNEVYNIRKWEKEKLDLIDYQDVDLNKLDFISLLYIYRRLNFIVEDDVINFREKIFEAMKTTLYEYEEKGRIDYDEDIAQMINLGYSITPYLSDDEEIRKLIEEFTLYVKIKTYSMMNIYDLLVERKKFIKVLNGEKTFDELGYPDVTFFALQNRIEPAVAVLIELKEDLILTEIFNLTRNALEINPFTVTLKEYNNRNIREFRFEIDARFDYNYLYYEDLGIETDIVEEEVKGLNRWQYDLVSEHLYKISRKALKEVELNSEKFKESYRYSLALYSDIEYVMYLINYVLKTMDLD